MSKRKLKPHTPKDNSEKSEMQPLNKHLKIDELSLDLGLPFSTSKRLGHSFFNVSCLELSKNLLGKYLIRKVVIENNKDVYIACKIVEVEAYLGGNEDSASHSFNYRKTPKNEAMFMKCGTAYVYNIYGIYCCLNITSNETNGSAVLLRAVETTQFGISLIKENRKFSPSKKKDLKNLTNGPSKLCQAMNITKNLFNKVDFTTSTDLWLQEDVTHSTDSTSKIEEIKIMSAKRIGIDYADQKAINNLYRFYIKDNQFVSVKSKESIQIN
jgi:DNA-3-methyladenine glycosylase